MDRRRRLILWALLGVVLVTTAATAVINGARDFAAIAAPSSPAAGYSRLYSDSASGYLGCVNSAGGTCLPPTRLATTQLSSAQILALFTTPVEIVPAAGAGLLIVPLSCQYSFVYGGVQYTNGGGGNVGTNFGAGGAAGSSIGCAPPPGTLTSVFTGTATNRLFVNAASGNTGNGYATNTGLFINKATSNFAAGNSTMQVQVLYAVVPSP